MRRAAGFLAGAVVISAAFRFSGLGFHNDDYALLAALGRAQPTGLLHGFAAEFAGIFYTRPLDLLFIPWTYALFGASPLPYHVLARLLDLACAWQFYRWLREEGLEDKVSLLAALFTALYPNHDAARSWPQGLVAQAGLAGTLWGLRLFRSGYRALGPLVFFATMLHYEASSLLAFSVPLLAWLKERKSTLRHSWPILAAFAIGSAWQRVLAPMIFAVDRHPMSFSPSHVLKVLSTGFECTFANRLAHLLSRGAQFAWETFSPVEWALCLVATAAIALSASRLATESERPAPLPALPLLFMLFFLGYAPYFFDITYMPTVFSANNRLNLTSALAGALFFAWLSARWRKGGPALAAILAAAFLLTGWASNAQYAEAYQRQKMILDEIEPLLPADAKTLLLYGFEERVGAAVVFESSYDLAGALWLRGHALKALVGQGRMRYEQASAVFVWYGEDRLSYAGLYAYDHAAKKMTALTDLAKAGKFLDGRRL